MLFSSGGEFFLVVVFLVLQLLLRKFSPNGFNKAILFLGNIFLLSTMITYGTIVIHLIIGAFVFYSGLTITKYGRSKGKLLSAIIILILILLFVLRAFPKPFGFETFQLTNSAESVIARLGISYILFRHIQYVVDCYKGRISAFSLLDYFNFILFFPNFLAGPIDKYNNFKRWQDRREGKIKRALILPGIGRITVGYIKKFLVVPLIYVYATDYQVLAESMDASVAILLSLSIYSLYIYLDFSGYSDIAIGSGYLMGVRTPENFDMPYLTSNIAEFWRKWHMTFSEFLRDLIFKPIVKGISNWPIKLPRLSVSMAGYILTFFICGIWHGETVNFVYWGLWHGVGLSVYKLWSGTNLRERWVGRLKQRNRLWVRDWSGILLTFCFVTFGWMFFHYTGEDLTLVFETLFK